MTQYETKILLHLNKIRGQNNVNHVLSEMLEMTEYDVNQAIISLHEKGYIYEDGNNNQKNDGLKAWKIHRNGEIKVKEITNNLNPGKEENLIKRFISKFWWAIVIPLAIGLILLIVEYKLFGFNR